MKKLMLLLVFLVATCGTTQAQIPDVTGEWEIRFPNIYGVGYKLLIETNLGQVDRHVHHEQIKLWGDGEYLMQRPALDTCFPPGPLVLDGDISDDNVLTLNFTNGPYFAVLTSELHLDVDDNQWEGKVTAGNVCVSFLQSFTARRHLPFSGEYYRQALRTVAKFSRRSLLSLSNRARITA